MTQKERRMFKERGDCVPSVFLLISFQQMSEVAAWNLR